MTVLEQTRIAFDYSQLSLDLQIEVRQRTESIKERIRRTAQDIVQIGNDLIAVKERLGHGQFGAWLNAEFDLSEGYARKLMQVARAFGQNDHYDRFGPTALMLLAAPGTPDEAREEAKQLAASGQVVTALQAEGIVKKHKAAARPVPIRPVERREAEEMDAEPLSDYEQTLATQHAAPAPAPVLTPVAAPAPGPVLTPVAASAIESDDEEEGDADDATVIADLPAADTTALRNATALVALLEQSLTLATVDLAMLRDTVGTTYTIPDAAVEQAAKLFLASPAVKGAAGFLVMQAKQVEPHGM